jgi:hypothetical protein
MNSENNHQSLSKLDVKYLPMEGTRHSKRSSSLRVLPTCVDVTNFDDITDNQLKTKLRQIE